MWQKHAQNILDAGARRAQGRQRWQWTFRRRQRAHRRDAPAGRRFWRTQSGAQTDFNRAQAQPCDSNQFSSDSEVQRRSDPRGARVGNNAKQRRSARRAAHWRQHNFTEGATPQGVAAVAPASSAPAGTPTTRLPPGLGVDRPRDATVDGAKRPRVDLTADPMSAPESAALSPQLAAASAAPTESAEAHQITQPCSMAVTGTEAEARRAARTDSGKRQAVPAGTAGTAGGVPRAFIGALAAVPQPTISAPAARGGPAHAASARRAEPSRA